MNTRSQLTAAQLYDTMRDQFGIGDWDEATSRVPYFRARMVEIARLKAMMRKRRVTADEVERAITYAAFHRHHITASWQVLALVPDANREQRQLRRQHDLAGMRDRLNAAAREAMNRDEGGWMAQFLSCTDTEGEALLARWRQHLQENP